MAVSRPLLLALLGLVLSAATLAAARGAGDTAADPGVTQAAAPVTPTPISPSKRAKKDAPAKREAARAKADTPARDKSGATDGLARKNGGGARRGDGPRPATPLPDGMPAPVGRALADRRVVVLFFGQGGADDDATADAVDGLRGLNRVSVFRDGIARLARYRAVITGLGVAQAPAVVIVGSDRKAQLVEGFVDRGTLEQLVLDAR